MADARGGGAGTLHPRQDSKIFCGGLSWGTTAEKLEAYFSNFGQVRLPYDVQYSVSEAGVLAARSLHASGNTAPECPWRQLAKIKYRPLYIMQAHRLALSFLPASGALLRRAWRSGRAIPCAFAVASFLQSPLFSMQPTGATLRSIRGLISLALCETKFASAAGVLRLSAAGLPLVSCKPHTGFLFVGLCFRQPHFGTTRLWLPNTTRSACFAGL